MFAKIIDYLITCTPIGGTKKYRILKEVGTFLDLNPRQVLFYGRDLFNQISEGESVYNKKEIICRYAYVSTTPLKKFDPVFQIVTKGHVLDYGSGIGMCFDEIRKKKEYKKYFLDIPGPAFDFVQWKYPDGDFLIAPDAELEKNKFDLIIITDVLEHLSNPVQILQNIISAIKPGGYVLYFFSENTSKPGHLPESIKRKPECNLMLKKQFTRVCKLPYLPRFDFLQKI
ncbi:MAG: class I SAM-dependent methyltransferase [Candidatus Electrothrix sp. AUS1_2]|nr:class I SAM-dependent methyltransferase [Candidatus Electrothrix sp. AUS1_2]